MKALNLLAFLTLLGLVLSAGVAPEPYCLSKPIYKQFPLAMEEILSHDMSSSFSGYNLDITIPDNINFATVSKKLRELDRVNSYFAEIVSHYIEKKDNTVGRDSFLLYKDDTGSYHFTYGTISDKRSLPHFNTTIIVTSAKNVQCFDAALFLDHGLAIIDCVKLNINNDKQPFTNIFFYIDLTGHKETNIVENQVYGDFKKITKRKLATFTNPETHYPYLIRAYFAEGVSADKDNTYIEFFGARDPYDLQVFGVVDRTFLHEEKLAINDLQVYNGDIYFLDSYVGLYRLDVLKDHKLLITGKLKKNNMQKFSIYSDDLEDEIIVALSNNHNIYEIDWSWQYMFQHEVINKYTIPAESEVKDIKVNGQYIIAQCKANVTNNNNSTYEVDYTWIFTKGSRTYMNAYQVIQHNSSKVDIDFDPEYNHIYSADESGIALFKVDEARLKLMFANQSMVGKSQQLIVTAVSTDPSNPNKTAKCTEKMTVFFTNQGDTKIYETGLEMNTLFSANYPGELSIPLNQRYLGPNITFGASNWEGETPEFWVDKVNRTFVDLNTSVRPQDITFFHTDMLQQYGQQLLVYYFEDTSNKTHIAECVHIWQKANMGCQVTKEYQHDSRISSFTTALIIDSGSNDWDYFYLMVLEGRKHEIRMIDFVRHKIVTNITYLGHQQAEISNIASSNGYLYVLRKNVKTIDVYNLKKCKQNLKCTLEFSINKDMMKNIGIDYFSPQQLITDVEHPQVLFIKCLGSIVVVDVDNKNKLHLLDEIKSAATKDMNFRVAVNKYRMVVVSQPDIIEEYSLQTVYQKDTMLLTKTYPMYGYRIQPNADIQFSDNEFMVYVNAYDPKFNVSVILVYRSGYPSSAVLYDTIYLDQLYSRPGFEIQVCGNYVDFVSIASGNEFKVYRVFEYPMLSLKPHISDFNFSIKAMNSESTLLTDKIEVNIVNFPSGFEPTQMFNDTLPTLKTVKQGNYSWDDRKWFQGHVLNYNYSCKQCNQSQKQKVKLREHLDNINQLPVDINDFIETNFGGIGVHQDLFLFRNNGSVREIINLPDQKVLQTCIRVASFETGEFVVTACQQLGRGVSLYMTSLMNFKPISIGPFEIDAYYARNLQVVHDVVMVVDQNAYPDFKINKGSVFLYRVSVNPDTTDEFDFLEEIDEDDLRAAHGWDGDQAYIGNAYLTHSVLTDTFRLYITEINSGFFVIDFTRHNWENEIHILSIRFVDMNELLKNTKLHMPSDATFQAITFAGLDVDEHFEKERVIITTKGYHNFQVLVIYDESDHIISNVIHKVYYRYGFYNAYNDVKSISGYVAIGYTLPYIYSIYNYTQQYVAIYDTNDYEHESEKGYAERYILGAFPITYRDVCGFGFNKTFDWHTNGSRIGLIVTDPQRKFLSYSGHISYSASISKTIQFEVKQNFSTQVLNVVAYSDFKNYTFNVNLIQKDDNDDDHDHDDHSKTDQILFVVVVIVAAIIIIVFGAYIFCVVRKRNRQVAEERVSLLTDSQSFVDDRIPPNVNPNLQNQQNIVPHSSPLVREDSGYSSDVEQDANNLQTEQIKQQQSQKVDEQTIVSQPVVSEEQEEQRKQPEVEKEKTDEQKLPEPTTVVVPEQGQQP